MTISTRSTEASSDNSGSEQRVRRSHFSRIFERSRERPEQADWGNKVALGRIHRKALAMVGEGVVGWSPDIGLVGGFLLNGRPFRPCAELIALYELRDRGFTSVDRAAGVVRLEPEGRELLMG